MWQWMRRNIMSNLTVKLFSIVLALALYLHVFVSQEREIDIDVPFMLHGVPETLTFTEDQLPEMVRVRFRGLGFELLKARSFATDIRLPISVGSSEPGHYHRPLVSEDVLIPRDIDIQVVEIISPKAISIDFDRLITRFLLVDPVVVGRPAPGYVKVGAVIVEPDSVGVRGPQRRLQSFGMPRAEAVDIAGSSAGLAKLVGVRVPAGCEAIPPQVTVRVMIEKVTSRRFTDLPVEVLHSGNIILRELTPRNGTVVVTGPSSVVSSLTADEMRLSIDALALLPGTYTLMASVELSRQFRGDAVSVEPVEPEKFEVKLE